MEALIIISITVLAGGCICLMLQLRRMRRKIDDDDRIAGQLLKNINAYILLIDNDFNVEKTNYYTLTATQETPEMKKVGNLLHCKNGEDAGKCGTHELCTTCPVRAAISEAFHTKKNFSGLEAPMELYTSNAKDATIACEVTVSGSLLDIDGQERMLLTVHDITALKTTQRELEKARIHAEESDRMKSMFLANTSHELRTPLNAIVGFSELLLADPSPEEKQEYARIIRTNNELLLQLVNDILDLSKIEVGTLEYKYTEEELNAVMEELEGIYRMKQADSTVHIEFRKKYPACRIRTDRKRMAQVISNFLSNAVKFTTKGEIIFGYEIRNNELYFYVRDTGTGIPEEKIDQVFKRFVKIGRQQRQGVGIGLAISKSIIESMGGTIGVESQFGQGSTFWFTLPAKPLE